MERLAEVPRSCLADRLRVGAVLVTVNNRLAHHLRGVFERSERDRGLQVWRSPEILPWRAFLKRLHLAWLDADATAPTLLSDAQETVLWSQVVEASRAGQVLLRPEAAIEQAKAALQLVCDWRLSRARITAATNPETRCFAAWLTDFEQRLAAGRRCVGGQLGDALIEALSSSPQLAPKDVILAGFEFPTPTQSALIDALDAAGGRVSRLAPPQRQAETARLQATGPDDEIARAADWARLHLSRQPHCRLAIVTPDPTALRHALEDSLTTALHPGSVTNPAAVTPPSFEFSSGLPLDHCPLVNDALLALQLAMTSLPWPQACALLVSPFFCDTQELAGLAQLSRSLRESGRLEVDRRRLLSLFAAPARGSRAVCEAAHDRWRAVAGTLDGLSRLERPSVWASSCAEILNTLGWPGNRITNDEEQQQRERFTRLLAEFATLDDLQPPLAAGAALGMLGRLARNTVFQPRGNDTPLQVLGMREAQGQQFDHLWILGLDDAAWPPAPQLNPLLPVALQREAGLTHSDPAGQLQFAQRITERMLAAAGSVTLSWSAQSEEQLRGPSPLLRGIVDMEVDPATGATGSQSAPPLETIEDDTAPTPETLLGGAALLADQSLCPFRAFVHHRLRAREIPAPEFGIEPWRIGNLLHRCLRQIWERLGDQQALRAQSGVALDKLVAMALDPEIERLRRERPDAVSAAFATAERHRLHRLLRDWLDVETERSPFSVLGTERECTLALEGMPLELRVDRIDRLEDGRRIVIDYKYSRNPRINGWTEARIRDPQLPLYVLAEADVHGAALACLRSEHRGFKGIAADADLLPGVDAPPQTWPALVAQWRTGLNTLAGEIAAGHAAVTPIDPKLTCAYCDLHAVCRIQESCDSVGETDDAE